MAINISSKEIKDDITVTQPVDLDSVESDLYAHTGTTTGNPHQVIAEEVGTADANGYFTATNVEGVVDELHELKEPKYLELPLARDLSAGAIVKVDENGEFDIALGPVPPTFGLVGDLAYKSYNGYGLVRITGSDVVVAMGHVGSTLYAIPIRIEAGGVVTEGTGIALTTSFDSSASGGGWGMVYHEGYDRVFCVWTTGGSSVNHARIISVEIDTGTLTGTAGTIRSVANRDIYLREQMAIIDAGTGGLGFVYGDADNTPWGIKTVMATWDLGTDSYTWTNELTLMTTSSWPNGGHDAYWDETTQKMFVSVAQFGSAANDGLWTYFVGKSGGTISKLDETWVYASAGQRWSGVFRDPVESATLAAGHDALAIFRGDHGTGFYAYMYDITWATNTQTLIRVKNFGGDPYSMAGNRAVAYDDTNDIYYLIGYSSSFDTQIAWAKWNTSTNDWEGAYNLTTSTGLTPSYGDAAFTAAVWDPVNGTVFGLYEELSPNAWYLYFPLENRAEGDQVYGILQETGLDGEIKKVVGQAGISTIHTGLTPGAIYYGHPDGLITSVESDWQLGKAIDANNIKMMIHVKQDDVVYSADTIDATTGLTDSGKIIKTDNTGYLDKSFLWRKRIVTETSTANDRDEFFADTTGGTFNIELPESPDVGTKVRVIDAKGNFGTTSCFVIRNAVSGENIKGVAEDLELDLSGAIIEFVFVDATYGWSYLLYV